MRLDKYLSKHLPDLSRTRLKNLILDGHVQLNNTPCTDPSTKLKAADVLHVQLPDATPSDIIAQDIPLDIIYETGDYLVINKPAGLVVHPAPGNPDKTLVNALLAHCGDSLSGIGGVQRPGIVHRLDKDTSGLMVVAKHDQAHQFLSNQFADRTLSRTYQALVYGRPMPLQGTIETLMGRHPKHRKKMAVLVTGGKEAVTEYRVLDSYGDGQRPAASLVECNLKTGRTHQIRVHLQHIGCPLIGDPVYGRGRGPKIDFPRQALHAGAIKFIDPKSQELVTFEIPPPDDFLNLINALTS